MMGRQVGKWTFLGSMKLMYMAYCAFEYLDSEKKVSFARPVIHYWRFGEGDITTYYYFFNMLKFDKSV